MKISAVLGSPHGEQREARPSNHEDLLTGVAAIAGRPSDGFARSHRAWVGAGVRSRGQARFFGRQDCFHST
jgi:hypothetical protein